ncbi:predicted protein [Botrytis cinerea T4]|uniref:Uncharacterized protein n=1 Tax=Botryotinia fuckeliana (strain T4) TaxID=999810 RepID=G2XRP9_BOTF4|nr:predicted protein [Botrytis cinerea T4]
MQSSHHDGECESEKWKSECVKSAAVRFYLTASRPSSDSFVQHPIPNTYHPLCKATKNLHGSFDSAKLPSYTE